MTLLASPPWPPAYSCRSPSPRRWFELGRIITCPTFAGIEAERVSAMNIPSVSSAGQDCCRKARSVNQWLPAAARSVIVE